MPLPSNHKINNQTLDAYTPSCGTTPVVAYLRVPFRCRVLKYSGILGGAITTADATITVANVTRGTTIGTFTITQSGSAAGQVFTGVPVSPSYANEDDVISFTPSGASGANIPLHVSATFKAA